MKLQEIVKMIAPVCALFAVCLVAPGVSGRGDYFFEPVINITQPNQEVRVDGCATPTMTIAFSSAINVSLFVESCSHSLLKDDNSALV